MCYRKKGEKKEVVLHSVIPKRKFTGLTEHMKVTIRSAAVTLKTAVRLKQGSFLRHLSPVWDVSHSFVTECGSMVLHR